MITIQQIKALEQKVNKAVELISLLKKENDVLKNTLEISQSRMKELENLVAQFKNEQAEIEKGIMNTLSKLNQLEDDVSEPDERQGENRAINGDEESVSSLQQVQNDQNPSMDEAEESENRDMNGTDMFSDNSTVEDNGENATPDESGEKEKKDNPDAPDGESGDEAELDIF
ncbi:MAG: cell division protein ZapB [Spirochaetales bacterium]|nr:cell division protein ZapB [Spirochaetales bacterium]